MDSYFEAKIRSNLETLVFAKLGLNENSGEAELIKLEKIVNAYKEKFLSLANPKMIFKEEDSNALINVINKCDEELCFLSKKLIAKLESMNKKSDDLLLAL